MWRCRGWGELGCEHLTLGAADVARCSGLASSAEPRFGISHNNNVCCTVDGSAGARRLVLGASTSRAFHRSGLFSSLKFRPFPSVGLACSKCPHAPHPKTELPHTTEMDGDGEGATAWAGGGESRQSSVTFGYARVKGLRDHPIEDYHVARMQSFDGSEIGLFAVYDGHAGTEVASYLEQELFNKILAHPNFRSDPSTTITEIYFSTDQRILDKAENEKDFRAGSTATTAFLLDNNRRLVVANVGDSRAVLARNGKAIEVSVDHEPQKPAEREMVESKGGEVGLCSLGGGVYRVDKKLNMSRAFGDYTIKEHLSVKPDIWDNSLTDEDDFFIVASDGLWKVMDNDEAVEHVLAQDTAERAAKVLAAAALRRGSRDDISVLVVCLKDLAQLSSGRRA